MAQPPKQPDKALPDQLLTWREKLRDFGKKYGPKPTEPPKK